MYEFSQSFTSFIKRIISQNTYNDYIHEIMNLILNKRYDFTNLNHILKKYKIQNIIDIRNETLDLLVDYANYILEDGVISTEEFTDFSFLKRIFKIKEGDFIKHKSFAVHEILKKEFIRIYSDHFVDEKEQLLTVDLQSLFGLSYDQFEKIKNDEVINALIHGANPKDLDIAQIPKDFKITFPNL